jgi:DNA-directed RNA polymerase alpha subunit
MITKEEVLKAIDIIEKYKIQELKNINQLEEKIIEKSNTNHVSELGLNGKSIYRLSTINVNTIGELLNIHPLELRLNRYVGNATITNINQSLKKNGYNKVFAY